MTPVRFYAVFMFLVDSNCQNIIVTPSSLFATTSEQQTPTTEFKSANNQELAPYVPVNASNIAAMKADVTYTSKATTNEIATSSTYISTASLTKLTTPLNQIDTDSTEFTTATERNEWSTGWNNTSQWTTTAEPSGGPSSTANPTSVSTVTTSQATPALLQSTIGITSSVLTELITSAEYSDHSSQATTSYSTTGWPNSTTEEYQTTNNSNQSNAKSAVIVGVVASVVTARILLLIMHKKERLPRISSVFAWCRRRRANNDYRRFFDQDARYIVNPVYEVNSTSCLENNDDSNGSVLIAFD